MVTSPEMDYDEDNEGKSKSAIEKDVMMRLIAEEMITSLMNAGNKGEDDDEDDEEKIIAQLQAKLMERERARKLKKKTRRKTTKTTRRPSQSDLLASPTPTAKSGLEELYYSHVGGVQSPGAGSRRPVMPRAPIEVLAPGDNIVIELNDHEDDSFAGGCLHELVDDKHRRPSLNDSAVISRESQSQTASETKDNSVRSKELSIAEIREYVMANIPQAVREQIPEQAWSQIFKVDSIASKTPSQSSKLAPSQNSKTSLPKAKEEHIAPVDQIEFDNEDDDIDDITVFSDVSGLTGAFPDGKGVETKREMYDHTWSSLAKVEEVSQNSTVDQSLKSDYQAPEAPGEKASLHDRNIRPRPVDKRQSRVTPAPVAPPDGAKKVSWTQVEVRYYERIVSDNPSVQSGPAIGIGWKYKRGGRVEVDYWEKSRGTQRISAELVLPRNVRERLLREAGVTQKEMAEMVRATLKVKNQRKQTINNLATAGVEEAVEKARKSFTRILSLGRKKETL